MSVGTSNYVVRLAAHTAAQRAVFVGAAMMQ
jgi:hypothetical protein